MGRGVTGKLCFIPIPRHPEQSEGSPRLKIETYLLEILRFAQDDGGFAQDIGNQV